MDKTSVVGFAASTYEVSRVDAAITGQQCNICCHKSLLGSYGNINPDTRRPQDATDFSTYLL